MRRSAGMGGESVLRAVGRAVGSGVAGVKGAVSATGVAKAAKPARVAALFSSSSCTCGSSSAAVVAAATRGSPLCICDREEWEDVEEEDVGVDMEEGIVIPEQFERFVFGPVPSTQEAEEAVSTIQQMFIPVSLAEEIEKFPCESLEVKDKAIIATKILPRSLSTGSQSDWVEPAMYLYSSKACYSQEREKVLDAFRLLQINPSIQRVVVSLSSDSAVWDAIMKNEIVQEFKKSFYAGKGKQQDPDEGADAEHGIVKWFVDAKSKIMEVLDNISKHLIHIFRSYGAKYEYDDVLRSSFMLSVLVFIVVVMNRAQRF